jgi:hypothetical protein
MWMAGCQTAWWRAGAERAGSGWVQVRVRVGSGSGVRETGGNPPWVRVVRVGPGFSPTLPIPPYARITRDARVVRDV